jgi:hypothetical protein
MLKKPLGSKTFIKGNAQNSLGNKTFIKGNASNEQSK